MYGFSDMIELGLLEGQEWPSNAHKIVATNLGICNPRLTCCGDLVELVGSILKVPKDRIKSVTTEELIDEFNLYRGFIF